MGTTIFSRMAADECKKQITAMLNSADEDVEGSPPVMGRFTTQDTFEVHWFDENYDVTVGLKGKLLPTVHGTNVLVDFEINEFRPLGFVLISLTVFFYFSIVVYRQTGSIFDPDFIWISSVLGLISLLFILNWRNKKSRALARKGALFELIRGLVEGEEVKLAT
jgi:hypothetical protein